jgi:hypothetical protein
MAKRDSLPIPTDRKFGVTFGCVFAALALWAVWKHHGPGSRRAGNPSIC